MNILNRIYFVVILIVLINLMYSCVKDLGNYNYTPINGPRISGIDSIYIVTRNDTLKIEPTLEYAQDQHVDTSNYEYSWLSIRREGFNSREPELIATGVKLSTMIDRSEGTYDWSFRVKDKRTGVWQEQYFQILITNDIYEGWYLLSEISGKTSRLDMLSYKHQLNSYQFMENVLGTKNPSFKMAGAPTFVAAINYTYLAFGTDNLATVFSTNNLVSKSLSINLDTDFPTNRNEAIGSDVRFYGNSGQKLIWNNGKVFADLFELGGAGYVEISKLVDGKTFNASPFISYSDDKILFDESNSKFLWYAGVGSQSCIPIEDGEIQSNAKGKRLLYMVKSTYNEGDTFAVLQDVVTNKVYLMLFTRSKLNYFKEISNTPIAMAENFGVSDDFGYLFYAVESKLYAYDINTQLNREMVDYGDRKISLLKFNQISFVGISKTQRYEEMNKNLCVGTYQESDLDNSGVLDIYQIQPALGQIVKESYAGFGKIKDITYAAR